MSKDWDVHQILFEGTFFCVPHIQCPYACCFNSDSEVNDRFSSLFSGTNRNIVPDAQMADEALNHPSAQSDVANDDSSTEKSLSSSDVYVSKEERHHRNGLSGSNTQDSLIAYKSGQNTFIPINRALTSKNTAFWPNIYNGVKLPHSLYPSPQDAIENPMNLVKFNQLLDPSVKQGKTSWMLNDIWNKRLTKPQYRSHEESNSLSSGNSSPSTESFDTKLSLNDDSTSCSGDSSGDFEYNGGEPHNGGRYHNGGEPHNGGRYHNGGEDHNGGEPHNGGEDHNDGNHLKASGQYRMLVQQEDITVPQSAAAMNMLQGDANLAKNENIYCPICFKKLKHLYYLRRHMVIHSGVKPFKCTFCPRRFSQTGNRNAHMRIHTGEKPFQCDFCDKKFTHASSKRRHIKFCQAL